jgi:hypothetical protein
MTVRSAGWRRDPLNGCIAPEGGDGVHNSGGSSSGCRGHRGAVFFLFSNRLGCLGSLLLSALLTLVLLLVLNVL